MASRLPRRHHRYCSALTFVKVLVLFCFPWHQCFLVDLISEPCSICGSVHWLWFHLRNTCFIWSITSVGENGFQEHSESDSLAVSSRGRSHWRKCLRISFSWTNELYLWCIEVLYTRNGWSSHWQCEESSIPRLGGQRAGTWSLKVNLSSFFSSFLCTNGVIRFYSSRT